ncbi:MAG: FMN-binding protein [Deltaproteobacteria bacterium]
MKTKLIAALTLILSLSIAAECLAKVYMTRDEALKAAFPGAESIEKTTVFLSDEQIKRIESLARAKLTSKLYTFYAGVKGGGALGWAVIDTHLLRTTTETVMIVINPDGTMRQAEILAFFEPEDYMPSGKWMALFNDRRIVLGNDSVRVGRGIPNLTGATITTNAMVDAIRRVMAVFEVALAPKADLAGRGRN